MGEQVLIATLGTEPQVITLVLDLLEEKGYTITGVRVVHTAGEAVRQALERAAGEFARPGMCSFEPVPVIGESGPVMDIASEADAAALLRTLYRLVLTEKRAGRVVHLSIAGGRKPMAVYGMVVAQLLFDEDDRVWHLLSEGWRPGDERVMHVRPGDRVWLVPVPVLRWSAVPPVLTELGLRQDPWDAIRAQQSLRDEEDRRRKREFLQYRLTAAERELVRLACEGLDNAGIADRLKKKAKTVANQFTDIYAKLHEWRGFRADVPANRASLVAEFAPHFALENR